MHASKIYLRHTRLYFDTVGCECEQVNLFGFRFKNFPNTVNQWPHASHKWQNKLGIFVNLLLFEGHVVGGQNYLLHGLVGIIKAF